MLGAAPKVELTAQEERRVCISDECGWIGPLSETVHPKHDASMILCPECHEVTELAQPAQTLAGDPIRKLIGIHTEYLDANPYCYFELAYTRRTDWMAWICSKPHADDPDRVVLACGQGSTPEEACARAIAAKLKGGL
ncbi:hypothetical protein DFP86_102274 [Paludibacterium purpuratum]|uniref:Uncharacterized protein n=2 Tax=Paludibacterium purpuratum TaxID=1144873 RepID=A0A4R7BB12_9NEIS|nr:hypothetical protein DFP86_102274 [Paludibacterium purpuratum]